MLGLACCCGCRLGWGRRGAEDFGEARVFVDADCHVDCCRCDEFEGARCYGVVGLVAHRGGECIDCICCEIGRAVQGIDEEEWSAEEESAWSGDHGLEAVRYCSLDREAF